MKRGYSFKTSRAVRILIMGVLVTTVYLTGVESNVSGRSFTPENDSIVLPKAVPYNDVGGQIIRNIIAPGAQAANYARYGEYPVDHSTGVPQVTIPLYTIDTGDFQLPVSVSYHASGNKVDDIPTPVGLGWVLNAGGVISRTVCAIPDFQGTNWQMLFKNAQEVQQSINSSINGTGGLNAVTWDQILAGGTLNDTQYDRYSYNFNGNAGLFRFESSSGTIFPIPYAPVKIERVASDGTYKITASDGSQYFFTRTETTSGTITSWYLTRIITPLKKEVTFTYTSGNSVTAWQLSEYMHAGEEVYWVDEGYVAEYSQPVRNSSYVTTNRVTVPQLLSKITWENNSIEFTYTANRTDQQKERLTSMVVKNGTTQVQSVTFDNSTYLGNSTANYRMLLRNLTIKGKAGSAVSETYQFTYDTTVLPNYYTGNPSTANLREDFWGYYNGANNSHVVPQEYVPLSGMAGANRAANGTYMKAGILTRIDYPTKGYTEFTFESNKLNPSLTTVYGGLRIKTITNKDYDGTVLGVKSYEYGTGQASLAITRDLFSYTDIFRYYAYFSRQGSFYSARDHTVSVGGAILPLTGWSGNPVFYTEVTEYNGTATANSGKTVYSYIQDTDVLTGCAVDNYDYPRFYSVLENCDQGIVKALPTSQVEYEYSGGSYVAKKRTGYSYTLANRGSFISGVRVSRNGVSVIYTTDNAEYAPFPTKAEFYNSIRYYNVYGFPSFRILSSRSVTDYDTNVSRTTSYTYDTSWRTFMPVTETTDTSTGSSYVTTYQFPFNRTGTPYTTMVANNYMDYPVGTVWSRGGTTLRTTTTDYQANGNNGFVPSRILEAYGTNSAQERVAFTNYDSYGNIRGLQQDGSENITILWGYGSRYPVAVIEGLSFTEVQTALGATYISNLAANTSITQATLATIRTSLSTTGTDGQMRAQVTTYTYSPLIGITSMVNPAGETVTYEYDTHNRLQHIRDVNNYITDRYLYNYRP